MFRKFLFIFVTSFYFVGCTATIDPKIELSRTQQLYALLIKYNPKVSRSEAMQLSKTAITYSRTLALKYNANTTPLIHNALVNMKLRDRGLCFQWADDLQSKLNQYGFKTMKIHAIGANVNRYDEHNALVVLPIGSRDLKQGVLLDPWRRSGELLFMPITEDTKYKWDFRANRV